MMPGLKGLMVHWSVFFSTGWKETLWSKETTRCNLDTSLELWTIKVTYLLFRYSMLRTFQMALFHCRDHFYYHISEKGKQTLFYTAPQPKDNDQIFHTGE